jgi:hypothetical protein
LGCVFHASNKNKSYNKILHNIGLKTYRIIEKGDLIHNHPFSKYLFSCDVSKAKWSDSNKQIKDMKKFIKRNNLKLKQIQKYVPKTEWRFDIPIESKLSDGFFTQCIFLEPELLKLCSSLSIGIELSYYPKSKKVKEKSEPHNMRLK